MYADEIESIKSMFDSLVTVSDRDKQRALELVLQSRTFVRSEQLRAFLRYVCSMEIEGRGEQITEYRIAVEALGRSQDYTTTEDSAVRNRAHALRVKLEELYTKELRDAPIRIDFFKGSYRPHFVVQKSPDENGSVAPVIIPAEMAKPQTVEPKLRVLGLIVAGLALAFLAGVWSRGFVKLTPDSFIAEAWGPLFNKDGDVLVSVASHSHMQVRARSTGPPESERAVDAPPPVYEWYRKYHPLPPGKNLYLEFVNSSTRFGDAIGAAEVVRTIAAAGGKAQIFPETSVSEAMFRDRNIVLIGMPENSSSIDRLLSNGAFRVLYDETLSEGNHRWSERHLHDPDRRQRHDTELRPGHGAPGPRCARRSTSDHNLFGFPLLMYGGRHGVHEFARAPPRLSGSAAQTGAFQLPSRLSDGDPLPR